MPSVKSICKEIDLELVQQLSTGHIDASFETGGPQNHHQSNLYDFGSNELSSHLCKVTMKELLTVCYTNKLRGVLEDVELTSGEPPDFNSHPDYPSGHGSRVKAII